MGAKVVNGKKYQLVPPDGGWGYMICVGAIINLITMTAFMASFDMLYKNLFIELKIDSTSIMLFNRVAAFFVATSGIFTAPLLKVLSIRQLGLITAAAFNIGTFLVVFVKSNILLFISVGILQSCGTGVLLNLSCTALNKYFVKKRLLAVSIVHTIVGVAALFLPQFIKWLLEIYGHKGTLLLVSGISLQNIVGTALMQPVEWHMKIVEVPEDKKNLINELLLRPEEKSLTSKEDMNMIKSAEDTNNFNTEKNVKNKEPSFIKTIIVSIFDVSLFKTFVLSNACVGMALVIFVEAKFTMMLPQALYAMGLNDEVVGWALSMYAVGDVATRILFIFISSLLHKIGSHETYIIGLILAFASMIGLLWSDNKWAVTLFITLMGVSRCSIVMLIQIVVADAVGSEKFSSAMGLLFLIFGSFDMIVGPIIGAIRDLTDSYSTAFYILTSFVGIVIIFWTIELIYKKNKHKIQQKKPTSKV